LSDFPETIPAETTTHIASNNVFQGRGREDCLSFKQSAPFSNNTNNGAHVQLVVNNDENEAHEKEKKHCG
jgi:hypothetical protein